MIFNQFEFLFIFLPVVLIIFFWARIRLLRPQILLAASLIFYANAGIEHAIVLVYGIIWVYIATHSKYMPGHRIRLTIACLGPLLALIYYKYSGFLITQVFHFAPTQNRDVFSLFNDVLLPAGISFFTFQLIAYACDRYRGDIAKPIPFVSLALYISFFPQLVAGPIVRFKQVSNAISTLCEWRPNQLDIWTAIQFTAYGLAIKILIADTISRYLTPLVNAPADLTSGAALYLVIGYSFQIFFDFYGYSLIAIGIGRLFGFRLPINFLRPYEALNPKDFWRRWHVTLSFWIRDYLYIPIGGNRRYILNIAIIFAACGLWHGADWTFVLWGFYHAVLVIGYSLIANLWDKIHHLLQISTTFSLVSIGWILFVFDIEETWDFFASLSGTGTATVTAPGIDGWIAILVAFVVCFGFRIEKVVDKINFSVVAKVTYGAVIALLFLTSLMFLDISNTFIYFRF